jgi:hypothetical protein
VIAVALLPPVYYGGNEKICPDCAEHVLVDANVCRFCGYRFAEPEATGTRFFRRVGVSVRGAARQVLGGIATSVAAGTTVVITQLPLPFGRS